VSSGGENSLRQQETKSDPSKNAPPSMHTELFGKITQGRQQKRDY
jgi:hypothetical protein